MIKMNKTKAISIMLAFAAIMSVGISSIILFWLVSDFKWFVFLVMGNLLSFVILLDNIKNITEIFEKLLKTLTRKDGYI